MPLKRGRPSKEEIQKQKLEKKDEGGVICQECNRTFPRRKSLNAHLRIHTGETPFSCTCPGCEMQFTQSGHLRTHIVHHINLLRFACPQSGCLRRYRHTNRTCARHKCRVVCDGKIVWGEIPQDLTPEKKAWIDEQKAKIEAENGSSHTENRRNASLDNFQIATIQGSGNLTPIAYSEAEADGLFVFFMNNGHSRVPLSPCPEGNLLGTSSSSSISSAVESDSVVIGAATILCEMLYKNVNPDVSPVPTIST